MKKKYFKLALILSLLTGCFQTEKRVLDEVTDSEYFYTICKSSCDNESNALSDAINEAKIVGISDERIEAAKALGRDKANRELMARRDSLEKKCKLENKIACYVGDGCCEADKYSSADAAADATAAAADAAADAAVPAADSVNEDPARIEAIKNEIKYAMDSYRYFYDLTANIDYPKDVYPPDLRTKYIVARTNTCSYGKFGVECETEKLQKTNSETVKLIYEWVGAYSYTAETWNVLDAKIREKARIDYDVLVQRGTDLTTKEAVDSASDYAKNAAKDYHPKIILDSIENAGL